MLSARERRRIYLEKKTTEEAFVFTVASDQSNMDRSASETKTVVRCPPCA